MAKVANVYVPVLYKQAVDALGDARGPGSWPCRSPLILAYGAARVLAQAFGELRDAIFAPSRSARSATSRCEVFGHLHALSLRFHLERPDRRPQPRHRARHPAAWSS